jgi:hypothetical protein
MKLVNTWLFKAPLPSLHFVKIKLLANEHDMNILGKAFLKQAVIGEVSTTGASGRHLNGSSCIYVYMYVYVCIHVNREVSLRTARKAI